ncbi:MAG: zf-HC2 domain-containing protein [Leifsonia sp.]
MTTHEEFATWDAAYVLGALSPTDRRAYEAHLRECERCAEGLTELAGLPGILSRVPREDALALIAEPATSPTAATADSAAGETATTEPAAAQAPGENLLPSLLHRARRRRARSRWLVAGLSAAAAAVLVGVGAFVLPAVLQPATPTADVVMQQVEPSPLSADLRLTSEPWGTRIDSRCSYARVGADGGGHAWGYAMVVTDRAGKQYQVSTWTADEGTTATPVATTSVPVADIASVDIRSAGDGTVLLRSTFD